MCKKYFSSCLLMMAALLCGPSLALAQEVDLGSADAFAVLSGSAVTCTDSVVIGDVGVANGPVTQTNCTIAGTVHEGGTVAQQAYEDFLSAYAILAFAKCEVIGQPLAGQSLTPGTYCFEAEVAETGGVLTLNGGAEDNWIFIIDKGTGALTFTDFSVVMAGGEACNNNVIWWTDQAATLTDSVVPGSILAGADITVTRGSLDGQALAGGNGTASGQTGAVTLTGTEVSLCGASTPSQIKVTGGGQIPVPVVPDSEGRATFGFNAQPNKSGGGAKGRLNYLNHVTGLHVNGPVDDVVVIATNPDGSPKTVRFSGTCGANLTACSFSVTVEDNGEPGTSDEFGIKVTGELSEFSSQRVISRGNIQFHSR